MKNIALALALILCFSNKVSAACDPILYAICSVKLTNGDSHEGIIRLSGGDCRIWMNGFRIDDVTQGPTYFFSLDFNKLIFKPEGGIEVWLSGRIGPGQSSRSKRPKLFFLQWEGYQDKSRQELVTDTTGTYLLETWNYLSKYKVLDEITIFTELTDYLFLTRPEDKDFEKYKKIRVPLSQVVSIELLSTPSKKWLNYIEKKRKSNPCYIKVCEDYYEPSWYHEALADKEQYNHIKGLIEESSRKFN